MASLFKLTRASLGALRTPYLAALPRAAPSFMRTFTTTMASQLSPRKPRFAQHGSGNKLKTHSGAKKRWSALGSGSGKAHQVVFKRGMAGKRHLNSGMSSSSINKLGVVKYSPPGKVGRTLRRLLGPSL